MNKQKKNSFIFTMALLSLIISFIFSLSVSKTTIADDNKDKDNSVNKVTAIRLSESSISITKGKKSSISANVTYANSNTTGRENIIFKSKNTSIATINQKGIIKAVGLGKTYIICTNESGTVKVRCKVVVKEKYNSIKSIHLDKKEIHLNKKDKRTLTATIKYGKKTELTQEPYVWSSSNNKIATVSKNGIVKGKKNGTAYITIKSKYTGVSAKCKIVVQKTKYIAFTFDDGPGEYTDTLLDALEKYNCKATFFVLGARASSYEKQLKRAYDAGMEIGSHTYSHQNLKAISKSKIKQEINKAKKAIKKVTGANPTLLRPPYGNYNKTVSKYAGVPMIYWDVDTLDWKYKKTSYVSKTILKQCGKNDIVLLHDIHKTSVDGFIKALPKLRKKGYELVTVSELYAIHGKKMKNGVMYFGPDND